MAREQIHLESDIETKQWWQNYFDQLYLNRIKVEVIHFKAIWVKRIGGKTYLSKKYNYVLKILEVEIKNKSTSVGIYVCMLMCVHGGVFNIQWDIFS